MLFVYFETHNGNVDNKKFKIQNQSVR